MYLSHFILERVDVSAVCWILLSVSNFLLVSLLFISHFLDCLGLNSGSKLCHVGMNWPSAPNRIMLHNLVISVTTVSKVKLATIVEGNPKAPFSIATTPRCRGGRYSFPGWLYFTLDPHLIMLSVKQGGIKYHFLSLWYDSTWDWTQVSWAIGEHSNR